MAGININKKVTETNLSSKTKPADESGITGRIVPGVPTTRVYTGVETDTAKVKVDNRNKTIAVEVKDWSHGEFSFEDNTIAIKNPETGNYESVIGPVETSLETTPGHIFNDTENTIYLAGDTERPIYVTEVDGKNVYSEIALLSDITAQEYVAGNYITIEDNVISVDKAMLESSLDISGKVETILETKDYQTKKDVEKIVEELLVDGGEVIE